MESLCNFSCCFDVKKDISSFVRALRDEIPAGEELTGSNEGNITHTERKPVNLPYTSTGAQVRIVGQERFNEVLFVWDDVSSFSNEEVTHVGLYDPAKQKNSLLFVHESKINIVSCTMNQERSMIAYVTLEGAGKYSSARDSTKLKEKSTTRLSPFRVYRAFFAEIFPQHRIFDLNVERRNLLRVQFLWNRQSKDRDAAGKESRLLFLLHKESIGLYYLPLARMGNKVMMSGPPATSQVLKHFIWAQWDVLNQLLFVVLMKLRLGEDKPVPILRCLEFSSKSSPFTKMLELVLPFPIKCSIGEEQYSDVTPSRTISENSFNMEVIYQANGSLCVCYQHPTKPKVHSLSTYFSDPDLSIVHTTDAPFIDSEGDSDSEDVENPSRLPHQSDGATLAALSVKVPRRRAITDISELSFSTPNYRQDSIHQAQTPEPSNKSSSRFTDTSSSSSSAKVAPGLSPSTQSANTNSTRSPVGTPETPSGTFSPPMVRGEKEPSSSPVPHAGTEKQDLVDLNYSVLVLHHMTVLHCSVPQIPRVLAENTQLYFTPLESYILVYSPGHVMHLLNVSPEVVPCLHIAFHGPSVPVTPMADKNDGSIACWDNLEGRQPLTHFNQAKSANTSGDCLLNVGTGKVFRVSINKDAIPRLLVQANCHSVKLALIHLATVHLRDSVLIQKVIKELSMDVTNLALSELMAEHLMGATFSAIRRQFDRDTLRLLQFTNTDLTRGQLVETNDGERLVSFRHGSYSTMPQINVHQKDWMERRLTMESSSSSLWENLEERVRTHCLPPDPSHPLPPDPSHRLPPDPSHRNKPPQRFHPRNIELEIRKQRAQSLLEGGQTKQNPTQRTSFLKKMAASARRVMTPSKKAGMPSVRDTSWVLMEEETALPDNSQDTILSLTLERLVSHLQCYSASSVSREKMYNMAQEYLSCQLQQVKQLVLLMLYSCGYPDPRTIPRSTITLNKEPPPRCYQLFHLIERFYMAVQSICFPVPLGFPTLFTIQGFRCLEPDMFLQYVDHGVLQLTEEFMTRLMQEVPDDTQEQVNMKIQIMTRLPKGLSVQTLQRWNHPIAMHYLAKQYVADTLKEEGTRVLDYRNRPFRSSSQTWYSLGNTDGGQSSVAATFPPLSTLLRLLENKDPKVGSTPKSPENEANVHHPLSPSLVEKVALRHTVERYGSNLSAVSF